MLIFDLKVGPNLSHWEGFWLVRTHFLSHGLNTADYWMIESELWWFKLHFSYFCLILCHVMVLLLSLLFFDNLDSMPPPPARPPLHPPLYEPVSGRRCKSSAMDTSSPASSRDPCWEQAVVPQALLLTLNTPVQPPTPPLWKPASGLVLQLLTKPKECMQQINAWWSCICASMQSAWLKT